jgi:hypothetical protein
MARKAGLKLVLPDPEPGDPPAHLKAAGRRLWLGVMAQYQLDDTGGLATLEAACTALDRAEELRFAIDEDGPVIRGKGGLLKDHPGLKHEVANRALAMRLLSKLGLDLEPVLKPGRPSGSVY